MNDEPQKPNHAANFLKMAERINHNTNSGFGGACVIVPPDGAGEPIEIFLIDPANPAPDPAQFLSMIATRIQILVQDLQSKSQQAFGMRR